MPRSPRFANRSSSRTTDRFQWPSLPVLTCGGIGLLMFVVAAIWVASSWRFTGRALRATGEVVRIHVEYSHTTDRKNRSSGPSYCPVVRFTTASEKTVEFTGLGAGEPEYEVGDEVTVLYLPHEPERGKIASFQELWLGPLVFAIMGAIFGGIGLLMAKLKF